MSAEMVLEREAALTSTVLRNVFSCFPSGVVSLCALTTDSDGAPAPHGMVASSFTSVSIDPPLVSVYIATGSSTWDKLRTVDRIGVSVLGAEHSILGRQMSVKGVDRFAGIEWRTRQNGAVFLDGAAAMLECSVESESEVGDHVLVVLRLHDVETDMKVRPLVFHHSRFTQLKDS
ncbi:flavin reductase family protein [Leifsonia kafniensis]|uniref:flavin reductase family protein n=1 Tax=Leifsonia kafniensis TaxID=475957 RepID=UPI0031E685A7